MNMSPKWVRCSLGLSIDKLLFCLTIIFLLSGCTVEREDKTKITVSIPPQAYFVQRIAGDFVTVQSIIPANMDPHIFEPSQRQLMELSDSDMYIKIGHPAFAFEESIIEAVAKFETNIKIIDMSKQIKFIESHSHGYAHQHVHDTDPHVWVSPENIRIIIETIYENLSELLPDNKEKIRQNYIEFDNELAAIQKEIDTKLSELDNRKFLIYHPFLGYFAKEFSLQQIAIEMEGKEPTMRHIRDIIEIAEEHEIKVIFVQEGFSDKSARMIADEIGAVTVSLNPMEYDVLSNLRYITRALAQNSH